MAVNVFVICASPSDESADMRYYTTPSAEKSCLTENLCQIRIHVAYPVKMLLHFALGIEQIYVHALGKEFGRACLDDLDDLGGNIRILMQHIYNGLTNDLVQREDDQQGEHAPEAATAACGGTMLILDLLNGFPLLLGIICIFFLSCLNQRLDPGHLHHALLALSGDGQQHNAHDHSKDDQSKTVVGGKLVQKVQQIAERLRNE